MTSSIFDIFLHIYKLICRSGIGPELMHFRKEPSCGKHLEGKDHSWKFKKCCYPKENKEVLYEECYVRLLINLDCQHCFQILEVRKPKFWFHLVVKETNFFFLKFPICSSMYC